MRIWTKTFTDFHFSSCVIVLLNSSIINKKACFLELYTADPTFSTAAACLLSLPQQQHSCRITATVANASACKTLYWRWKSAPLSPPISPLYVYPRMLQLSPFPAEWRPWQRKPVNDHFSSPFFSVKGSCSLEREKKGGGGTEGMEERGRRDECRESSRENKLRRNPELTN